jgi:hypothetical protein
VLRPIVENALTPLLANLPDVSIPEALARVQITPGDQTQSGGVLTQRALRIQASVLGTSIADLTVGTASVSGLGADCQPATPAQAALACTKHKLVLTDVLPRRSSVLLVGAADRSLAGKTVDLVFDATGRTVAQALVKPDGSFTASAPLPPKGLRGSNLARYRAVLAKEQSLNLKLQRRMLVTDTNVFAGKVTITGRVTGVLAKGEPIVVKRRTSCTSMEKVATVVPDRDGRFSVTFKAPKGQIAPVYRLQTRVRKSRSNPKTFPTFTLPRAISVV